MSWAHDYFRTVDSMNVDAYLAFHTEDVRFRFGNAEPALGTAALRSGVSHFWSLIKGLRHDFAGLWELDDAVIAESLVTYTRLDGREVVVPATTILRRRGDKVHDVRIYIDLAPLFA
jgi:hypothetical protein